MIKLTFFVGNKLLANFYFSTPTADAFIREAQMKWTTSFSSVRWKQSRERLIFVSR